MFVVMSWPWRIETAGMRPMTSVGSAMTPLALVGSSGTWRTSMSASVIAWRAGMTWMATTAGTFWACRLTGLLLGLVDQEERRAARDDRQDDARGR